MNAKDKAKDLIRKFRKECALIAVDEILKSVGVVEWDGDKDDDEGDGDYDGVDFTNFFQYWEEVKQEIIKL